MATISRCCSTAGTCWSRPCSRRWRSMPCSSRRRRRVRSNARRSSALHERGAAGRRGDGRRAAGGQPGAHALRRGRPGTPPGVEPRRRLRTGAGAGARRHRRPGSRQRRRPRPYRGGGWRQRAAGRRRLRRSPGMEGAARLDGQCVPAADRSPGDRRGARRRGPRPRPATDRPRAVAAASRRRPSTSRGRCACCSAAKGTACRHRCWPQADARIRLPMRPPVESLNVAVAGGADPLCGGGASARAGA